jgi:hypothetical protein
VLAARRRVLPSSARKLAPERSGRTRREPPTDPRAAAPAYTTSLGRLGGAACQTIAWAICSVKGRDLRPRSRAAHAVSRDRSGRDRLNDRCSHGRTAVLLVRPALRPPTALAAHTALGFARMRLCDSERLRCRNHAKATVRPSTPSSHAETGRPIAALHLQVCPEGGVHDVRDLTVVGAG